MATVEESDSVLDGYWTDTRVHDCCLGDGHILSQRFITALSEYNGIA